MTRSRLEKRSLTTTLDVAYQDFCASLQQLCDLIACGLAGASRVKQADYLKSNEFFQINLSPQNRWDHKTAREHFETWCLKCSFTDATNLLNGFLETCRIVAAVQHAKGKGPVRGDVWSRIVEKDGARFRNLDLPDKLAQLHESFDLTTTVDDHIRSLHRVANCLVLRGGVVTSLDTNTTGKLKAKWRFFGLSMRNPDDTKEVPISGPTAIPAYWTPTLRVCDGSKTFAKGDSITFTPSEHTRALLTFFLFGRELYTRLGNPTNPAAT